MNNLFSIILGLFLIVTVFSCKKDKKPETNPTTPGTENPAANNCDTTFISATDPDTLFTSSYLMAYPGSTWYYDNNQVHTCSGWHTIGIVHTTSSNGCVTVLTTNTIAAKHSFLGNISGVNRIWFQGNASTTLKPWLSEQVGQFYYASESNGSGEYGSESIDKRSVTELLDSMEVNGVMYYDVIHVHQHLQTYYYHMNGGPYGDEHYYFANNVGLIRMESSYLNETPTIMNLVSYSIGPH